MTARARNQARNLARHLALARDLAEALDLDPERALVLARVLARTRSRDGAQAHAHVLARARLRMPHLAPYLAHARDLALALTSGPDPTLDRARTLARALRTASRNVGVAQGGSGTVGSRNVAPATGAVRLIRGAVRVLPAEHRDRYRDEFDSELYELAAAGAARAAQLAYALRLLDRAWILRAELRECAARRTAA
jgi:hypothetical protein